TFILSVALVASADPTPSEPGPGQIFNEGLTCHIAWTPDPTGNWKTLNIELMTGDNFNMVHLTTVATVDGTTSPGTYDYPCPGVTPHAPIYFYQFTSPTSPNRTWTGRFTITDSTGAIVAPSNPTQPNGQPIPWGTGALADPSKAVPAPPYLTGGSTNSNATSSTLISGTSSLAPSSAVPSTTTVGVVSSSISVSSSSSGLSIVTTTGSAAAA
ncbi:hypothetical protein B0F90DRAFT_1596377, partial [Multifurca ochricompacta]